MNRILVSCAAVLLAIGCEKGQEAGTADTATEAPSLRGSDAPVAPETPDLDQQSTEKPEATHAIDTQSDRVLGSEEQPTKPTRDLAAELRAAVGSPVDCLQDYQPSEPRTIRVAITAIARPSGVIIEPSASGTGLSANDRRCIEERVGDVVLTPLDTSVSQPVSTSVDLRYEPPAVEEHDVGAPPPKLNEVVEPLPKKETIPPSGIPIQKAPSDRPDGPHGDPIEGPKGVPIEGPKPKPIDGYEVEDDAERWTD